MNGKTILLAFVLVSFYFAGIASAQVIPIAACGTLAVPGATYQLTVNITGFAGGNCMNIVAGGITLDCLGNTINGVGPGVPTPDVGVFLNGVAGVTVRNCQVNQFPFGVYLLDSSFNTVSNNNVSANGWGITLDTDSNNNTVSNNLVTLNNVPAGTAFGISIRDSVNNIFFNNLINNTVNYQNVGVTVPNFFNTTRQPGQRIYSPGTDIGGNYWSNPAGNGYSDSCTDSNRDGFCDTPPPFTLPDGNTDNLPLSNKYVDTTPPVITVISPQNTVYNTTSFWANVTTNESCSNAYYSLNGGPNTNLTLLNSTYFFGNVTTSIIGGNSIVFYAVDLAGNIGVSNTTYFTVSTPAIAGCPITINIPGNYYLTNNLGSAYSQTCITVNSSNVVLDCRGRSITGNGGSYGVDNPRFSNVTVRNCVINTYGSGIRFGQDKYGGANSGLIENNILNSCSDFGVLLYRAESNVILNNTAQNCGREGFIVYYYSYANIVVNNTAQNNGYGFNLGDIAQINQLYGNRAKNNSHYGIELIWAQGNVVHDNIVDGNGWAGIFLQSTDTYGTVDNVIYNNLFNNTMNVEWLAENIVFGNQWNTGQQPGTRIYSPGTEIGGNYWSGPSGGYSDTCTDNNTDGFCDDAYYLADGNIDYLPLSDEYPTDTTPPVITILSPQNTTYSTSTVGLTFTVNEPTSWIGYSLDGAANITITGNTTLSGLSDGPHNVIVYARDTSNNLGASVVVYFSVSLPANPISACPYSMNSPGTYVLTQNLTASGTCITVNSANVVLDCMGHSITGVGTTGIVFGIYNPASDNVTVKNCVVRGYNAEAFEYGIEYGVQNCYAGSGPVNGLIYNNTLDSNWQGIYLCGCASDLISNNTVNNSGNSGIQFDHGPSSGILVTNNVVTNTNGNGIGTGN
ncbi:MAG: right-handed parallel beta-helix repeat-containing protein, partial [Candidatus Micrarchaeota archaeon]|nr:right-handed parallel beta-helix repeat-containing protein [Candidatus Micrarchaeota archaeon]